MAARLDIYLAEPIHPLFQARFLIQKLYKKSQWQRHHVWQDLFQSPPMILPL